MGRIAFTDEQVNPSIGKAMRIHVVDHWFYSLDGLRATGQMREDGGVMVSSLASESEQAAAISLALRMRRDD